MSGAPLAVMSLAAWCDLERMPKGTVSVGVTSFKVREYALLSDGREVTLLDDRGWGTNEPLAGISVAHVVGNLHMAVLPDDAEEAGEDHEWGHFVDRLREAGVAVTVDELRLVPYGIILSDRRVACLGCLQPVDDLDGWTDARWTGLGGQVLDERPPCVRPAPGTHE